MTLYIDARPHWGAGGHSIIAAVRQCVAALARWHGDIRETARKRRNLNLMHALNDHILKDIGIERLDLASAADTCRRKRRRGHGNS